MRRREPNRQNWNFGHKANCQCPTCKEERRLRLHGEEERKADSVSCPECEGEGKVVQVGYVGVIRCPLCLGKGWLPKHFAEARARRLAEGQQRASRGKQPDSEYDALLRESRGYYARIKADREQSKSSEPLPPTPPTRQVWDEELGQMVNVQPARPKERRPDRHTRPENETSRRRPGRGPDARTEKRREHPLNRYTEPDASAAIQEIATYSRPRRGKKILVMAAVVAVLAVALGAIYLQNEQAQGQAQTPPPSVALPPDGAEASDSGQADAMVPTFTIIVDETIPPDEAYLSLASQSVSVDGVGLGHPPEYGYPEMLGTTEFQRALGECGGSLHIHSELSWHLQVTDSWVLLNEPFSPLRNETSSILWWLYGTDGALSASGSIDADCAVYVLHPASSPTPTPTPTLTRAPALTRTPEPTPVPTATPTPTPTATPTPVVSPSQMHIEEKLYMLELINARRESAGLGPVVLGDNIAAQVHAEASLEGCFSSHWGLDGLKPYMRYSLAGGYQANGENGLGSDYCIRASDGYRSIGSIKSEIREAMNSWMGSPGHRDNILDKWHKKVNIGLAWDRYNFKAIQHFEGDYVRYDQVPGIENGILALSGTTKNGAAFSGVRDLGVQIYYDAPPYKLTRGQVARTYCYDLGLPIAGLRYPPGGNSYYPTHTYTALHEPCPSPYEVPPDSAAPRSHGEANQFWLDAVRASLEYPDHSVVVRWITAMEWTASGESFSFRADLRDLLAMHGDGVYSLIVWGKIAGEDVPISEYSIFHDVTPPGVYSMASEDKR